MKADQFKTPPWLARVSQLENRAQTLSVQALQLDFGDPLKLALIKRARFERAIARTIRQSVALASVAMMKARPLPAPKPSRLSVIAERVAMVLLLLFPFALAALACAMHLHAFAK